MLIIVVQPLGFLARIRKDFFLFVTTDPNRRTIQTSLLARRCPASLMTIYSSSSPRAANGVKPTPQLLSSAWRATGNIDIPLRSAYKEAGRYFHPARIHSRRRIRGSFRCYLLPSPAYRSVASWVELIHQVGLSLSSVVSDPDVREVNASPNFSPFYLHVLHRFPETRLLLNLTDWPPRSQESWKHR